MLNQWQRLKFRNGFGVTFVTENSTVLSYFRYKKVQNNSKIRHQAVAIQFPLMVLKVRLLPEHSVMVQLSSSIDGPLQLYPPYCGSMQIL